MRMNIWPQRRVGTGLRKAIARPKPVNVGMKTPKYKKGNLIHVGAVGAGKLGMTVGKKIYKFK